MATTSSAKKGKGPHASPSNRRISTPSPRKTPAPSAVKSQTFLDQASDAGKHASKSRTLSYSEAARKASKQNHGSQYSTSDKIDESATETDYWTPFTSPQDRRSALRSTTTRLAPQSPATEDVFTSPLNARIPRSSSEIAVDGNQCPTRRIASADTSLHHLDNSSLRLTVPPAPINILDFVHPLVDDGVGGTISRSASLMTIDGGTTLSAATSARSFSNFGASRAVSRASTLATEMYSDHDVTPLTARTAEPNFEDFQAGLTPQKGLSGSASSPVNSLRRLGLEKRVIAVQGYTSVSSSHVNEVATPPRKSQWPNASADDSAIVAAYLDEEFDESFHSHNASFEVEDPSFYASAETSIVVPSADTSFHGIVTGIEDFGGVLGEMELLDESETGESSDSSASGEAGEDDEEDKENRPAPRARLPPFLGTLRSPSDRFREDAQASATTFERSLPHERTPLSLLHSSGDDRAKIWNAHRENDSRDIESGSSDEAIMADNENARYRQALASKYLPNNSWSPELDEYEMEHLQLRLPIPSAPPGLGSTSFASVQNVKNGRAATPVSPVLVLKASPGVIGSHLRSSRGASGSPVERSQTEYVQSSQYVASTTSQSRFSPFGDDDAVAFRGSRGGGDLVGLGIHIPSANLSPSPITHASECKSRAATPTSGAHTHTNSNAEREQNLDVDSKVDRDTTKRERFGTGEKEEKDGLSDEPLQGAFVHLSAIGSLFAQRSRSTRRVSQEPSPRLPVILEVSSPPISMRASIHVQSELLDWHDSFSPNSDPPIRVALPPDISMIKTCGLFLPFPFEDLDDPDYIPDWWYGPAGAKSGGPLTTLSKELNAAWKLIPNVISKSDGAFTGPSTMQPGLAKENEETRTHIHGYNRVSSVELVAARSEPHATSTIFPRVPAAVTRRSDANTSSAATLRPPKIYTASEVVPSAVQPRVNPYQTASAEPITPAAWNGNVTKYGVYATDGTSLAYRLDPAAAYTVPVSQASSSTQAPPTVPRAMLSQTLNPSAILAPPPPYSRHQSSVPASYIPTPSVLGTQRSATSLSHPGRRSQQPMATPLPRHQQASHVNVPFARSPTPAAFLHQHQHQQSQQQQQQHLYPGPRLPASMIQQHQQHAQLHRSGSANHPRDHPPRLR